MDFNEALSNIMSQLIVSLEQTSPSVKCHKPFPESYGFIPWNHESFICGLWHIKQYMIETMNVKFMCRNPPKFFDAGCGIGLKAALAHAMHFDARGQDILSPLIELGNVMFETSSRSMMYPDHYIKLSVGDIRTHQYHEYDCVYYYCPFASVTEQQKFENILYEQMKANSILFAVTAKSPPPKRFHNITEDIVTPDQLWRFTGSVVRIYHVKES